MSPAERQAREEQADRKSGDAAGKRYNALSSVAPSKDPRDDVRGQKGYAKGGMTKKRRFVEGGETEEMANASEESKAIADEAESAGARSRGQALLEEMRDRENKRKAAKPAAKARPSAFRGGDYSNEGRGREMTKRQQAEYEIDSLRPTAKQTQKGLEDASMLMGGAGLKAMQGVAKRLATPKASQAGAAKRASLKRDAEEGIERNLESEFKELASSAAKKQGTAERSRDLAAGQGKTKFTTTPKATDKNPAKRTKKFDDSEANVEFKNGGSVSRRADGIAQRGKTRGKMC